jgi:hypothetical protein
MGAICLAKEMRGIGVDQDWNKSSAHSTIEWPSSCSRCLGEAQAESRICPSQTRYGSDRLVGGLVVLTTQSFDSFRFQGHGKGGIVHVGRKLEYIQRSIGSWPIWKPIFASRKIQDLTWRNMKGDERYSPNQPRGIIRGAKNPNLGCRNPDSLEESEVAPCPNRKNPRCHRHGPIVALSKSGRPKFQNCVLESSSEVRGMFPKENMLCSVWDANYNCVSIYWRLLSAAKIVRP